MNAALGVAGLDPTLVQIIIGVVGTTGLFGTIIAFVKLRPDVNTAAVSQAQGAAETMAVLQRELVQDRDAWRERALLAELETRRLTAELETCQKAHGRRSRDR